MISQILAGFDGGNTSGPFVERVLHRPFRRSRLVRCYFLRWRQHPRQVYLRVSKSYFISPARYSWPQVSQFSRQRSRSMANSHAFGRHTTSLVLIRFSPWPHNAGQGAEPHWTIDDPNARKVPDFWRRGSRKRRFRCADAPLVRRLLLGFKVGLRWLHFIG